jgi:hypothetical protein
MKKIMIISLIIIIINNPFSSAQKDSCNNHVPFGFTYSFGVSNLNFDNLNKKLSQYNYPELKNSNNFYFPIGFLVGNIKDIGYTEIEVVFNKQTSKSHDGNRSAFTNIDFGFKINININPKGKILIHPFLGWEMSSAILRLTNDSYKPPTIDSVFNNKQISEIITRKPVSVIDIGIGADKSLSKDDDWFFGIRAGYKIQINKPKWSSNNANIDDFPGLNLSIAYIGATLTFY